MCGVDGDVGAGVGAGFGGAGGFAFVVARLVIVDVVVDTRAMLKTYRHACSLVSCRCIPKCLLRSA